MASSHFSVIGLNNISKSPYLFYPPIAFGAIFLGYGLNTTFRPSQALGPWELEYPTSPSPSDRKVVDTLMSVYGTRDMYIALSLFIATAAGDRKCLGWLTIAASGIAVVDGFITRKVTGGGEWNHWITVPVVFGTGIAILGAVDGVAK